MAGAFNITNGSWDSEELTRIEAGIVANAQEPQAGHCREMWRTWCENSWPVL